MAQQLGVDYSFARPSPASIAAAGYTFVMRYLASSTAKRITLAEANAIHAAGLTLGLVFEDFADPLENNPGLSDYNGGVADATFAVNQANAIGFPGTRPIYVAVDVGSAYTGSIATNTRYVNYFQGWSDTITKDRVGFYGGSILWSYLVPRLVLSQFYFWQASAASWSAYVVPYNGAGILQGLGSVLGGTSDPDTAFVNDFGQWPAPTSVGPAPGPAPKPGGTNVAGVTQDGGGYAQTDDQTLITPNEVHDQVIYSVTTSDGSLGTGAHNGFYSIPTAIGQTAYPIGTFSYDGGTTYNDFGFELPVTPASSGVYPGVQIQAVVTSAGTIVFNGVNNTGSSVNLIINVALLATDSPKSIPKPQILGGNLAYTNIYPKLTSDETTRVYSSYRRIAAAGTALGSSVTVAHNQSSIPNIMFWVDIAGSITINPVGWRSDGAGGDLGVRIDSSNIYFHVNGATYNNAFYRVYKDN